MLPDSVVTVWPAARVIRVSPVPVLVLVAVGVGVEPIGGLVVDPGQYKPAEFIGILIVVPATNETGFTSCKTATHALYRWAMEFHVSPLWTVWNVTHCWGP